jgi:hypothetical protein
MLFLLAYFGRNFGSLYQQLIPVGPMRPLSAISDLSGNRRKSTVTLILPALQAVHDFDAFRRST